LVGKRGDERFDRVVRRRRGKRPRRRRAHGRRRVAQAAERNGACARGSASG
jgi:hypothetical protein